MKNSRKKLKKLHQRRYCRRGFHTFIVDNTVKSKTGSSNQSAEQAPTDDNDHFNEQYVEGEID